MKSNRPARPERRPNRMGASANPHNNRPRREPPHRTDTIRPQGAVQSQMSWRDKFDSWSAHHSNSAIESLLRMLATPLQSAMTWLVIAIAIASVASLFENLIQLVNIIGSIFYGNVLGIFLLAFFFKRIQGKAVFYAAIVTQILVIAVFYADLMSYLWLNVLGCGLVILIAHFLELFSAKAETA